jgi:hypothetical protein
MGGNTTIVPPKGSISIDASCNSPDSLNYREVIKK